LETEGDPMSLVSGTHLGPYEILHPIGAGGMGQVYKARDTRLNRTVAIKVLPPEFATRPDWKQRFEREAQTIASLNHPHICTLHDVGQQDGIDYLVMEFLEGQTLAQRLEKGALSLDEALKAAIEIADALDKAHRQGIVHRDLKPANVMLTKTGVKLLDFGLAKPNNLGGPAGASVLPTAGVGLTAQGAILGTLQYMAPEQLEGEEVDARTDIFAFGAVIYEMITGCKAFQGKSQASLIAAILEHEPAPMKSISEVTPTALQHLVAMCLRKEPDDRWVSCHDIKNELRWIQSDSRPVIAPAASKRTPARWLAAVSTIVAGISLFYLALHPARLAPTEPLHVEIRVPNQLSVAPGASMLFSHDGKSLIYQAVDRENIVNAIYIRPLDRDTISVVRATDDLVAGGRPFVSPDGEWLGFYDALHARLRKVRFSGGDVSTIVEGVQVRGATWTNDGTIVYTPGDHDSLWRVSDKGGTPERITTLDAAKGETSHRWPEVLPDGSILFTVLHGEDLAAASLAVVNGRRETTQVLSDGGFFARYSPSGHILFVEGHTLFAATFDMNRLQTTGKPVAIEEDISVNTATGAALYTVSKKGMLAFVRNDSGQGELVLVDRHGTAVRTVGSNRQFSQPRLSSDGANIIAVSDGDLWVIDFNTGREKRLTSTDEAEISPVWIADGKTVGFISNRRGQAGVFAIASDGSEPERQIANGGFRGGMTSAGRSLFVTRVDRPRPDVVRIDSSAGTIERIRDGGYPAVSPDGRWLAFASAETGRTEVYVLNLATGRTLQVSNSGGVEPIWCQTGGELFFRHEDQIMSVPIQPGTPIKISSPTTLFSATSLLSFDVTPDCQQILMVKGTNAASIPRNEIHIVTDWVSPIRN
jgi:serine/threonine protein kinase/Tol biopolymer transport system component